MEETLTKVDENTQRQFILDDLVNILKELGITQIISYDDEWTEVENNKISEPANEGELDKRTVRDFITKNRIKMSEAEETNISNLRIVHMVELLASEEEGLQDLINKCRRKLGKSTKKSASSKVKSLKALKGILDKIKEKADIGFITRSQPFSEKEDFSEVTDKIKKGRFLFILDIEMNDAESQSDVVIEALLKINKIRKGKFDLVVVLSHSNLDIYSNYNTKLQYVTGSLKKIKENGSVSDFNDEERQLYLMPHQLWAFKKVNRSDELLNNLVETIKKSAFGHSLHDYLAHEVENREKALVSLMKTPEEDYEILYKDCYIEGEPFTDVLKRLNSSILRQIEYELLSDNGSHYKNIIRNVLIGARKKSPEFYNQIKDQPIKEKQRDRELDFYRKEIIKTKIEKRIFKGSTAHGLIDYSVNAKYSDIMTGDVFRFKSYKEDKECYGILVTPTCDLVIRYQQREAKEEYIGRKAKELLLLPCKSTLLEGAAAIDKISSCTDGTILWPIKVNNDLDQYCMLEADKDKELMVIDPQILDLCSVDSTGWAGLTPCLENVIDFKTDYFNVYIKKIVESFINEIYELDNYIPKSLTSQQEVACSKIEELCKDDDIGVYEILASLKYNFILNKKNNRFEIQRVGRLESSVALELAQKKYANNSRHGRENLAFLYTCNR